MGIGNRAKTTRQRIKGSLQFPPNRVSHKHHETIHAPCRRTLFDRGARASAAPHLRLANDNRHLDRSDVGQLARICHPRHPGRYAVERGVK